MTHELCPVRAEDDWAAVHHLRRTVLFTPERHLGADYDSNHPADRAETNQNFVLKLDTRIIGCVRLDTRTSTHGIVRLVAIDPSVQRQGHGRVLEGLVADLARSRGMTRLTVNAAPDAVGFYERQGWHKEVWDVSELVGIARDCVQMVKGI